MTEHHKPPQSQPSTRAKVLDLSFAQLFGGALAASAAAALGSRLGVAGTITGAALGSVTTAVVAAIYTGSVTRAREVIITTRRLPPPSPPTATPFEPAPRGAARRVLVSAAAVFAVAAAFLTGVQLSTGAPVTGTSLGGHGAPYPAPNARPVQAAPADGAAPTPTSTPPTVTATVTAPVNGSTAPATQAPASTATVTGEPSPAASTPPSPTPTSAPLTTSPTP